MPVEKVVRKIHIKDRAGDRGYWMKKSPEVRLSALEEIRREYHRWRYGAEPGFQRVYSIIKRS